MQKRGKDCNRQLKSPPSIRKTSTNDPQGQRLRNCLEFTQTRCPLQNNTVPETYLTPRTKSESSTPRALAMLSKESIEAVRHPFSSNEIKTTESPAFSASLS
jgi:hypothetical protein